MRVAATENFPARERLRMLEDSLKRITDRLRSLRLAAPQLPMLVGGAGEKVTLRLVAEYADMWNTFGSAGEFARRSAVLDQWCVRLGRDPATIERTVLMNVNALHEVRTYVEAGATHVMVTCRAPFDLDPIKALVRCFSGETWAVDP